MPRKQPAGDIPELIHHGKIARRLGVTAETVRRWSERGAWPAPTAEVGRFLFYRLADVTFFLDNHRWPAGTKFRGRAEG